jgi:hypothetical protein
MKLTVARSAGLPEGASSASQLDERSHDLSAEEFSEFEITICDLKAESTDGPNDAKRAGTYCLHRGARI